MTEPLNLRDYHARTMRNMVIRGHGVDTTLELPCPFCGAASFLVTRVIDTSQAIAAGNTCKDCGRSARAILHRSGDSTEFEIVQTGGREQPDWLVPQMRRMP